MGWSCPENFRGELPQEPSKGFLTFLVQNPGKEPLWYAVVESKVYGGWPTRAELFAEIREDLGGA